MKEYIEKSEAVECALYTPIMSSGAVREEDRDAWIDGTTDAQEQVAKSIGEIPAADVVPGAVYRQTVETLEKIREEAYMRYEQAVEAEEALADVNARKHGEWHSEEVYGVVSLNGYVCSVCGGHNGRATNFCPNCGADMRGEKHEP